MNKNMLKAAVFALGGLVAMASLPSVAQDPQSLDELLKFVEEGRATEAREHRVREQRFIANRNQQRQLLQEGREELSRQERRSEVLEQKFEELDQVLAERRRQLQERLGALTELFGHLTGTAGDMRSNFQSSLVSAQYPGREEFLDNLIARMAGAEELPRISEIERMWFEMQREMIESGRIVKYNTEVTTVAGEKVQQDVVRVGVFNIVNESGDYLRYVPANDSLVVLARQPSGPFRGWARSLAGASEGAGLKPFGIDPTGPTGGSYLAALIDSPTLTERWHQGGVIGYIISAVGVIAAIIAIWRLIVLTGINSRVNAQMKNSKANDDNPLGRVLMVHEQNPTMDSETLELKLSEAVLKEIPQLENSLNLLKIIAAVAPLMGLLGTVTGMIITFQAITIFGAGDPKAMAGGISSALVTTVLGLCVAIPTVLLHTIVNGRAKKIIHVLDEQSAGIIAQHTESSRQGN